MDQAQDADRLAPPAVSSLRAEAAGVPMERSYSENIREEREELREAAEQTLNVIVDLNLDDDAPDQPWTEGPPAFMPQVAQDIIAAHAAAHPTQPFGHQTDEELEALILANPYIASYSVDPDSGEHIDYSLS